ncbi:hypothetical protein [Sutcliffiella halmapala]|uniref:hypothetical protein n=1 Tax=Sutcliffiella halmapala TaxID=79882 RepID=UPI000994DD4B|nr:hypothetical protein [Sutcliffiella halmapala]
MNSGFNKITLGLVIVLININIGFINLLPDIIGYMMIASGTSQLGLEKARNWAVWLAVLSLPTIFNLGMNLIDAIQFSPAFFAESIYIVVLTIFHILLIFELMKGFVAKAEEKGLVTIVGSTKKRINIYATVSLIYLITFPFILNLEELVSITVIILISFVTFFMEIMIILLVRQYRNILAA